MRPNERPDAHNPVQKDDAPGGGADQRAIQRDSHAGINPQNTDSMSRAEDDDSVFAGSPEFHDQPTPPHRP